MDLSWNIIGKEGAQAWGSAKGARLGAGRGTWMVVETRESQEVLGLWILWKKSLKWNGTSLSKVSTWQIYLALLGLIVLNFPFVCNFLLNNLHLIELQFKFLSISLRTQHLLLRDISTCSHCKRKMRRIQELVGKLGHCFPLSCSWSSTFFALPSFNLIWPLYLSFLLVPTVT